MLSQIIYQFESLHQRGETPRIQDHVPTDIADRDKIVLELIKVDVEYRRKRKLPITAKSYLTPYPELARRPKVLLGLVLAELRSRDELNEPVDIEAYAQQYPEIADALREKASGTVSRIRATSLGSNDAVPRQPRGYPKIPGYELKKVLGEGGMGIVYLARHQALRRDVALKQIKSGADVSAEELERFRDEAEAVASFQHPNIVQIFEIGASEETPFFALEYCAGGSLAQRIQGKPWKPRAAAQMMATLARAIHAAHKKGIVHRDLKPHNVLLTEDDEPKISDFGLAKRLDTGEQRTQTGAILGTPSYMPPEQAAGKTKEIGPLADVYSLGAILYELLTGRPPFRAATPIDTVMQVIQEEPVAPRQLLRSIPRDLETICLKCLEKNPRQRYAAAVKLAKDLECFLDGEPISARPVGSLEKSFRWCKRHPVMTTSLAGLVFFFLVGIPSGFWLWYERAQRTETSARMTQDKQQREKQLEETLADLDSLIGKKEWDQAAKAAKRARGLVDAGEVAPAQKELVAHYETAVNAVFDLEEVRVQRCGMPFCIFNYAKASPQNAFQKLGIDVLNLPTEVAAERIKKSPAAEEMIAALDDWCWVLRTFDTAGLKTIAPKLAAVASHADPEPIRVELRNAMLGDDAQLTALADRLAPDALAAKGSATNLILIANVLHSVGKLADAVSVLQKADTRYPSNFWINLRLAEIYSDERLENWTKSLAHYQVARALRPNNHVVLFNLGSTYAHVGELQSAHEHISEAMRLLPDRRRAMHHMGILCRLRSDEAGAIRTYEQVLREYPDYAPSQLNLAMHLMGHPWRRGEAAQLLEKAYAASKTEVGENPDSEFTKVNHVMTTRTLAICCRLDPGRQAQARGYFEEATQLGSSIKLRRIHDFGVHLSHAFNMFDLGLQWLALGDSERSKRCLETALPVFDELADARPGHDKIRNHVRSLLKLPPRQNALFNAPGTEILRVEDKLAASDMPDDRIAGAVRKKFEVKLEANRSYIIDLQSEAFDSFLRLEDADGKILSEDDDSGGGLNARIVVQASRSGVYRIVVTSYDRQIGPFVLRVGEGAGRKK